MPVMSTYAGTSATVAVSLLSRTFFFGCSLILACEKTNNKKATKKKLI